MSDAASWISPERMPEIIPVFPLSTALLLPRARIPLHIFEPRYLAMVEDALRGERIIGLIQPVSDVTEPPALLPVGCAGKLTQFTETGDGRYLVTLTGIARFRVVEEIPAATEYRQCRVTFSDFVLDFTPRAGEDAVDRDSILSTLRQFADLNDLEIDWQSVRAAPNEALVNALSIMSPYGPREKQALLEAPNLQRRAEVLVAITEVEIARTKRAPTTLQ